MIALHKALIEAIVYIATAEGSDDREDDDIRALESVLAELRQATPNVLESFLAAVKEETEQTGNQERIDALDGIIETLSY